MKVKCHLTVGKNGSTRVTKSRPNLNWDEISIALNLDIPDMLFEKPQLQATINVPTEAASPKEVDVDVLDNIKEAIQEHTGLEIKLTLEDNNQ